MKKLSQRQLFIGLAGVVALASITVSPACARVERENVDGVDCVVVKSPIGQPRHVDCDWPAEDSEERQAPQ